MRSIKEIQTDIAACDGDRSAGSRWQILTEELYQAAIIATITDLRAENERLAQAEKNAWQTVAELRAEVERLRAALKPFAEMLKQWEDDGDISPIGNRKTIEMNVSVADLRRATALADQGKG